MTFLGFTWYYVIVFLVVLTVLVFVHELGHYLVARKNGVRVEVFSIGFGPEIKGWTDAHGTRWKLSAVPLGGYVKMYGETDFDEDPEGAKTMTEADRAVSFHHKRIGQRAAIVAAGPIANFLFAMVVLAFVYATIGLPAPLAGIGEVVPSSAAAKAGLQAKDRVVAIDGKPIKWFDDLRRIVMDAPNKSLQFDVVRGESKLSLAVVPTPTESTDGSGQTVGVLGVRPDGAQMDSERQNPLTAAWMGITKTVDFTGQILQYLGQVIAGQRTAKDIGGPLGIAQMSGQVAQDGIVNLIVFMAALSINLGLINLFPIPLLDGGHLLFYAAEAVRGRPLSPRIQEYGFRFGLVLVCVLMIFATWNDLVKFKFIGLPW